MIGKQKRQHFFVRVTSGTEQIAWRDIERVLPVNLISITKRRIDFFYGGSLDKLLTLRSVDDVYIFVGEFTNLTRARLSLERITKQTASLPLASALSACQQVRPIPQQPTYAVTASLLGKRNYSRYDVADAIQTGITPRLNWQHQPYAKDVPPADIDLRVLIEDSSAYVGIRLGQLPLHRRAYKQNSLPGSTKAPVAYCMCFLAGIQSKHVVLDPMCGVGTIAIEAKAGFAAAEVLASDSEAERLNFAQLNAQNAGVALTLKVDDAARAAYPNSSVDRIVTNLPWGKQVSDKGKLGTLYNSVASTITKVLRENGRAVLLTTETMLLHAAIASIPELQLAAAKQISLFGSHPTIFIVVKSTNARLNLATPFTANNDEDEMINLLAQQFARDNLAHDDATMRLFAESVCALL